MEHITTVDKNSGVNNLTSFSNQKQNYNTSIRNDDIYSKNDLFYSFHKKFNEIFEFIKYTNENKKDLEDEIDENLIKTLYNLCQEILNYINHINDFGNMNLCNNDQELIIESYENFVRHCKQYNDKLQVKQLENEISNLLDLLFNNTSEAVNILFSANSFFVDHVENLKIKLTERNQKIEFENERLKKLELEAKVEEYDAIFDKNKEKNNEMDETLKKLKKEINKLREKIEKYDNYMKKKRKEIDINFSDTLDCKERIKLLEENIKSADRNMKTTQLSPLKIIEKTDDFIILEFTTIRNVMQFKVNSYHSENVQVEINPCDQNILSYINENIKKCKDISEITYLIKEAIYLNFLDI
ncbi:conserved Plasmodium protein, unknown function [Plasmodium malariae]|uniref:Uncharacterized protein n=1 Tax=Plasmodium malariae TaxID=5858 RepID=A0A1D3SQD2_PLAMA|nr:conserved Plasmodium protein, unknown function [Plasmodium malariae]SCO94106.1 conserved Plasmodium protein, unknown function [Plasmodium malariae]